MTEQDPNNPQGQQPWDAQAPTDQPAAPQYGQPDAFGQPAAQPDPYGQPAAPQYGEPDPFGQPAAQQYGQPDAFGQSGQPVPAPYPYGAGNPAFNPVQAQDNLKLNYWLSVFFSWIPALIFFLTEKDKNQLLDDHLKENMNFQITRIIAMAVMVIPVIGTLVGGIAGLALFVLAIMGAMKAPGEFQAGRSYRFPFAIRILK